MSQKDQKYFLIIFICISMLLSSGFTPLQQETGFEAAINSPLPGEAVQGLVIISGTFNSDEFDSYTLEFSFADQSPANWFLITRITQIDEEDSLGEWDTSTITDGNYTLRLTVELPESDPFVLVIDGIRVRNYSTIETNTPEPTSALATKTPTIEVESKLTATAPTTPTPFSPNQANFSTSDFQNALIKGGIIGLVGFTLLILIFFPRQPKE